MRYLEDQLIDKSLLQCFECELVLRGPFPDGSLFGEIIQRLGKFGIMCNEMSIVVSEPQEGADFFDVGRDWPLHQAIRLDRIHVNMPW